MEGNHLSGDKIARPKREIRTDASIITENNVSIRGDGNVVNGNDTEIRGDGNTSNGNRCTIKGDGNTIRGNNCIICGDGNQIFGNDNTINGVGCQAFGSNNNFGWSDDAQKNARDPAIRSDKTRPVTFVRNDGNRSTTFVQNNFGNSKGAVASQMNFGGTVVNDFSGPSVFTGVTFDGTNFFGGRSSKTSNSSTTADQNRKNSKNPSFPSEQDKKKDEIAKEGTPEKDVCIVCSERLRRCIIKGCNHVVLCVACSLDLKSKEILKCPVCTQPIESIEIIYM